MYKLLYQSIKVTTATLLAIVIAELLQLHYSTTAGVIAMLSVLDTRKQSMVVGLKRLSADSLAVVLAILLFNLFGHKLWVLGLFLLLFIPLLMWFRSTEALAVGTVLVTHIYTISTTDSWILFNELALLTIGVLIAWVLNLHVLNLEDEIRTYQEQTEKAIKEVLIKMKFQLLNQCSISEQANLLESLEKLISEGSGKAVEFNNNHVFKDDNYYHRYFNMRRQQYHMLAHMQGHFALTFITVEEAKALSAYTEKIALELHEYNDGGSLMEDWYDLRDYYRQRPLPTTRDEFENRATLYQYLMDLAYFNEIKVNFAKENRRKVIRDKG